MAVVTNQPLSAANYANLYSSGSVTVRNLQNTLEDCDFSGRLVVEAFRSKMVHATSERKLPLVIEMTARYNLNRPQEFYEREFIAEYDGQKAGTCVVRYYGDKAKFPDRDEDVPSGFNCCDYCGLICLSMGTEENVKPGYCYLDHICVDSKFRGKGVGKVLLDVAEADARKKMCKVIYLFVMTNNPAQRLYSRQGYVTKSTSTCCVWCTTGEKEVAHMEKQL